MARQTRHRCFLGRPGSIRFDPIEAELRERIRGFLEEMIEQEATAALGWQTLPEKLIPLCIDLAA